MKMRLPIHKSGGALLGLLLLLLLAAHGCTGPLGFHHPMVEALSDVFGAICVIFSIGLAIGMAAYLIQKGKRSRVEEGELEELADRLEAIERRLSDTQEVMIALSDKFDRLEKRKRD